jgi:hypothetical protein
MAGHERDLQRARIAYVAATRRLDEAIRTFRAAGVPLDPGPGPDPVPWTATHVRATKALAIALADVLDRRKSWDGMRKEWKPSH